VRRKMEDGKEATRPAVAKKGGFGVEGRRGNSRRVGEWGMAKWFLVYEAKTLRRNEERGRGDGEKGEGTVAGGGKGELRARKGGGSGTFSSWGGVFFPPRKKNTCEREEKIQKKPFWGFTV